MACAGTWRPGPLSKKVDQPVEAHAGARDNGNESENSQENGR